MKAEFDNYIENYRHDQDGGLWMTGYSSEFFAQYKAKKLREWLPEYRSCSILDFGCGDGVMTYYVSKEFDQAQLTGVDPSPKSIERARKNYPHLSFSVNSDQNSKLNFDDNQFDIIFAAGVFHHIPFNLHKEYIQELTRILSQNGTIVLFELNPLNPGTQFIFKRSPIEKNARMLKPWYTYFLAKNYVKNINIKFYSFFPKLLSLFQPLEPLLVKFPFGGLYAVILKKT